MTPRYARDGDDVRLYVTRQEQHRIVDASHASEDVFARILREVLGETVYGQLRVAAREIFPKPVALVVVDR
jgi:hypothetical protein